MFSKSKSLNMLEANIFILLKLKATLYCYTYAYGIVILMPRILLYLCL